MKKTIFLLLTCTWLATEVSAQYYNSCAGQNVIYEDYKEFASKAAPQADKSGGKTKVAFDSEQLRKANEATKVIETKDKATGEVKTEVVERKKVHTDGFGNARGNQYDLAVDGAFKGHTVAVLQLYTGKPYGENFDFVAPTEALAEKGFSVFRWLDYPPSPEELREKLQKACQLWIISNSDRRLNDEHLKVIKEFFDSGRGVYIWGDNEPFYADANYVGAALLDITMSGNLWGDQTVGLHSEAQAAGIVQNHLITTGMNYVYEGITIATIAQNEHLTPLIWGSAGNLVTAVYERDGKRAIFDGGFTRLYNKWDTAGTGRYVKNAAAWLANPDRFGDDWDKEKKRHGK